MWVLERLHRVCCCYGIGDGISQPLCTCRGCPNLIPNTSAFRSSPGCTSQWAFLAQEVQGARVHICLQLEMVALCPECSPLFAHLGLLLTAGISSLSCSEALWSPVSGSCAAKAGCVLRGRFQPLCAQHSAELFDQHKLWQSGIINFPQPTTWNSWKDGLSLFLAALAGLNCPLHCPAAAQEGCMPRATALLLWAWDLNPVSSVREKKEFSV